MYKKVARIGPNIQGRGKSEEAHPKYLPVSRARLPTTLAYKLQWSNSLSAEPEQPQHDQRTLKIIPQYFSHGTMGPASAQLVFIKLFLFKVPQGSGG